MVCVLIAPPGIRRTSTSEFRSRPRVLAPVRQPLRDRSPLRGRVATSRPKDGRVALGRAGGPAQLAAVATTKARSTRTFDFMLAPSHGIESSDTVRRIQDPGMILSRPHAEARRCRRRTTRAVKAATAPTATARPAQERKPPEDEAAPLIGGSGAPGTGRASMAGLGAEAATVNRP
jgi:hypothetical protein